MDLESGMTVKGGKKCHICLERKRYTTKCDFCGHNTCFNAYCLRDTMCLQCRINPIHRTLKELRIG